MKNLGKRKWIAMFIFWGLTLFIVSLTEGSYLWEMKFNEPLVGKIKADPLNPKVVWALTSTVPDFTGLPDSAHGIWKSTDGGETWIQMNDANLKPEYNCMDIAISSVNPDIIYVGTNLEGVFRSTDGGITWAAKNSGLPFPDPESRFGVSAIAVDPTDPALVYCGVSHLNNIDLSGDYICHPGFFKSTNGGNSWVAKNTGPLDEEYRCDGFSFLDWTSHTVSVASISVLPQRPNYVLVGVWDIYLHLFGSATSNGRFFYSTNRAEDTWKELSTGLPSITESGGNLANISASLMSLSCASGAGIAVYGSHMGAGVAQYTDTTIAKSKSKGVYKLDTAAKVWVRKSEGLPMVTDDVNEGATNAGPVAISPLNPKIMLVGIINSDNGDMDNNNSKVFASRNGGTSWIKNWDSGMTVSSHGYEEANPLYIDFNCDQSAAFAGVYWDNVPPDGAGDEDDGVWRVLLK